MRRDPTEFRKRFTKWKNGELVYENGRALPGYRKGTTPGKVQNKITFLPQETETQKAINEWSAGMMERIQPSARSKVILMWNATGKKPQAETLQEYTKRRIKKETNTWLSNAADVAHMVGEAAIAMSPYTAVPYFGAKVLQDALNGNVGAETALNVGFAAMPFMPKFILPRGFVAKIMNSKIVQNNTFMNSKSALGEFVGDGSESTVYINKRNPKEVLKVYDGTNLTSMQDAKAFSDKMIRLRNSAPQVPIRRYGYIKEDGKIKPVFALERLPDLISPDLTWNDPLWLQYQKRVDDLFHASGWSGSGTYTKGSLTASDVQPANIGFYESGEIAPFDIYVE